MKKLTLKQLQEKLNDYESLLNEYTESLKARKDYAGVTLVENGEKIIVPYDILQEIPLGERYEFVVKLINNSDHAHMDDNFKAVTVLQVLGFQGLAHSVWMSTLLADLISEYKDDIESLKSQIKQKEINSTGGKNRTSRHKKLALKIAANTWKEIPGASVPSLSTKIFIYLNGKFTDVPEVGTINSWLNKSNDNPKVTPKIRDYNLVVDG